MAEADASLELILNRKREIVLFLNFYVQGAALAGGQIYKNFFKSFRCVRVNIRCISVYFVIDAKTRLISMPTGQTLAQRPQPTQPGIEYSSKILTNL